jgi:DNA-binding SARP family transcriptional activator
MIDSDKSFLFENDHLVELGDIKTALIDADGLIKSARNKKQKKLLIHAQINKARILLQLGNIEDSYQLASDSLTLSDSTQEAVEAFNIMGYCASEMNDLEASEDFFQKAVSLSRALDYPYGLGWSLHHLAAYVYFVRGQFDLALSTMDEAGYFKKIAQCNHWGSAYLEAYIKTQLGDRRKARKALDDLVEMVKPATRLAGLYFFLWAKISLDEQELEKADEYLRLALRIANQTGHPALNIWTRIEKSRYYRILGQPSVALPWAEDALGFSKRTKNYFQIGSALMEKAQVDWEIGDLNTAEKDLLDAKKFFENINASYNHAYTTFLLSALYQNQHNSSEEKTYLEAAEQIIKGGFESILEKENQKAFPLIVFHIRNSSLKVREVTEAILEKLSHIPPTPLHILGFGQFRVWQGKRLIPDHAWQRRKAGELFRYLLLQADHSAPREILIETLWPDMPLNTATANFHQATSTLRHIFEADLPEKFPSRYFTIEGERVFLHIPVGSSVDFEIFETMLPPAILNRKIDELSNVLAAYSDDLFPMDRYADWSTDKRSRLEELYISGLINLGELFYLYQEHFKAVDCCLKILKRDPWNEDAVLLAMKAYSSMNNAPRALSLYLELETCLAADLGIKPRSDLRNLVEEIRKR